MPTLVMQNKNDPSTDLDLVRRATTSSGNVSVKELAQSVKPEGFAVHQMTAQGDVVVVEGTNRGVVHKTGRRYEHDWVMLFTVRDEKMDKETKPTGSG